MKLFGGAITADIPQTLLDASDLREVPDHQEVFVGTTNSQNASLIVELLEPIDKPTILECLTAHVEELHSVSNTDGAELRTSVESEHCILNQHETQIRLDLLTKGNKTTNIIFALFKLQKFHTDVLITCTLEEKVGDTIGIDSQFKVVRDIVSTFKVHDPSLFVNH
ncbi:Ran GTPase-binding protein [Starmerella bacillaris]|uniref:Ran GTPase-binding protein n=1 Tax=Starmerella bacillaris TaxID=1247836 RepID=A0AAV5RCT4_STABA|nr:Ran GTPase-binding protein [Starmerella bacillaris]